MHNPPTTISADRNRSPYYMDIYIFAKYLMTYMISSKLFSESSLPNLFTFSCFVTKYLS